MNIRIKTFLLLLFLCVKCNFLVAQSYLSFGSGGVQHEDTLHIGDSIHFSFWLVNQGNVPVNDTLQVLCETFDVVGTSISSMLIGDDFNVAGTLDVGDSILINIVELVTLASYVVGDNIIVIWPASIIPGNSDTSSTPIHILNSIPASLELSLSSKDLLVFPNPTNNNLMMFNNLGLPMEGVTVSDVQGNLLYIDKGVFLTPFYFDFSAFHPGIYYISTCVNSQQIVKRVVFTQ